MWFAAYTGIPNSTFPIASSFSGFHLVYIPEQLATCPLLHLSMHGLHGNVIATKSMVLVEERRERAEAGGCVTSDVYVLFLHSVAAAMDHEAVGSNKDPQHVSVQKNTTQGALGQQGECLYPRGSERPAICVNVGLP